MKRGDTLRIVAARFEEHHNQVRARPHVTITLNRKLSHIYRSSLRSLKLKLAPLAFACRARLALAHQLPKWFVSGLSELPWTPYYGR